MLKKSILILSLFSISFSVLSQNFEGYVGGGITASQVSGDSYSGFNRLGANLGIYTTYKFKENQGLSIGIQFLQKGSQHNATNSNPYNYSLRLNYLEVPFEYIYTFADRFAIDAGVSFARLMKSIEKADYAVNNDPYNKNEFNALVGINFPIKDRLVLTVKYENTLFFSPIRDHKGDARHRLNWGQYNSLIISTLSYRI